MMLLERVGDFAPRSLASRWPEAAAEGQAITQFRDDYEAAIKGRSEAGQTATNLRAARDVAKENFLTVYAEIMSRVAAEFPRDTAMQDLFFDDVRARSRAAQADDAGAEPSAEGGETPPAP